jgi:hypothetical protein
MVNFCSSVFTSGCRFPLELPRLDPFPTILVLAGLMICSLIWFGGWARTRQVKIRATILALAATSCLLWWWFTAGWDRWNILVSVATLVAVVVALFLDDIRALLHFPEIELHVGNDLIDPANDFDDGGPAYWIRGRIKNIGHSGLRHGGDLSVLL